MKVVALKLTSGREVRDAGFTKIASMAVEVV
jgi:ribosomal protein L14